MIGEKLGHVFDRPLGGLASKLPFSPNSITIAGFVVTAAASAVLSYDLLYGGLLVLAGGFFDALDGVVARRRARVTAFGAFLDSVLDRYSDALIFAGIGLHLGRQQNFEGVALSAVALVGSVLISYIRARAEGLGWACNVGLMERPERLLVTVAGAVSGLIIPALWVLAILTHVTAAQRLYHVWRLSKAGEGG